MTLRRSRQNDRIEPRLICWAAVAAGMMSAVLTVDASAAAEPATTSPSSSPAQTQAPTPITVSRERMLADIQQLAGPAMNGRQTGTVDDLHSALWVADRFRELGLIPAAPRGLHASVQPGWLAPTATTVFTIDPSATAALLLGSTVLPLYTGADYLPVLDSAGVDLTASVTFVGYGLVDPALQYDDYAGVDVTGRVAVIFRGKPSWYEGSITQDMKVRWAQQRGAVAVLMVVAPTLSAYEARRGVGTTPLASYGQSAETAESADGSRLPIAWISADVADRLLNTASPTATLAQRQDDIVRLRAPRSTSLDAAVRLQWTQRRSTGTLHNVIGLLPGGHPDRAQEAQDVIIVGAHRDHFGHQAGQLFPGADDNASGTAVVLEVARTLASTAATTPLRRSVLFVSFSGEEQGLLGSRAYVAQPALPLARTRAMVNIDHAGIGNGRLTVGVTGLDRSEAAKAAAAAGLGERVDLFGFFPGGDHVPFKEAAVPTITVVSGGPHPHYHQPTDRADTINPDVLQTVAQYVLTLVRQLAE